MSLLRIGLLVIFWIGLVARYFIVQIGIAPSTADIIAGVSTSVALVYFTYRYFTRR